MTIFLFIGDIFFLYIGLFSTLFIRYGLDFYTEFIERHFLPFSVIFPLWLVVFYIAGLYDLRQLRNNLDFFRVLGLSLFINAILSVAFFYFIPAFGITPKTNLFIFILIFAVLEILWRRYFNHIAARSFPAAKVILIGENETAEEISRVINENPQLGYEIKYRLKTEPSALEIAELKNAVKKQEIEFLAVPHQLKKDSSSAKIFYEFLTSGIAIKDLASFYEIVLRKVPLAEVNEEWILENFAGGRRFYDGLKQGAEFLLALTLFIVFLPLTILIVLLIKISSSGPAVYKQTRIGRSGRRFILYKFRTMRADAEKGGPQWAQKDDERITTFGRFLRYTHLDELLQFVNILKGDLSFVGPRPERPEFVNTLRQKIPYYETRHLVKPGITGWAQINYRYGSSVEDAVKKLEYDIYYLKNRSLILDLAIVLKTIKSLFVNIK